MAEMVKPWIELTDTEKREAIAVLLGWRFVYSFVSNGWFIQTPDQACGVSPQYAVTALPECANKWEGSEHRLLGRWPTDDGQAVADVWPKIVEEYGAAGIHSSPSSHAIVLFGGSQPYHVIATSASLADAICQVAYERLRPAAQRTGEKNELP